MKRPKLRTLLFLLPLAAFAFGVALYYIDDIVGPGGPPPRDYYERWEDSTEQPRCGYTEPISDEARERIEARPMTFMPEGGGDLILSRGSTFANFFDYASPVELDDHDTLVIHLLHTSETRLERLGPDLMICGKGWYFRIVIMRQYCHDISADPPWNNEIEEIVFPKDRESWLSNELYDSLPAGSEFPDAARRSETYGIKEDEDPEALTAAWTLKPFREVLPGAWGTSVQCRLGAGD